MPRIPHIIGSLRGGLNENAPATIADDQCTVADNVEWVRSPLGERRAGGVSINLGASALTTCDYILWLHRHLPGSNLADAQLWVWGARHDGTTTLAYKDSSWHDVPVVDPLVFDGTSEFHIDGQSLHGKLFIAYRSTVDRLHVWDGANLRRTGLAAGALVAPGIADFGSGTFSGTRWYRIRFVAYIGTTLIRRSEPNLARGHTPSGTGAGVEVTRTGGPGDGETHWELEASDDNVLYYRIATLPYAALTAQDITPYHGYTTALDGIGYPLAEDIGDYSLIPSCRFISVDEDRLICGSAWTDPTITSRIMWTPPAGAVGAANDERLALDTTPYLDLDTYEGGDLTNISSTVNGYIYCTKWRHIYQLTRTGVPTRAYEAIPLTKQRGAIPGSLVEGFDQGGKPFVFVLDPDVGPCMVGGAAGVEPCGDELIATWPTVNLDATVAARAVYFPEKRQVMWWIATGTAIYPNLRLVLHTHLMRRDDDGARGGFALWRGPSSMALAACLYSDNIDSGAARTRRLKPFLGFVLAASPGATVLIARTDTGDSDWGTPYTATLKTKAVVRQGLLDQFECGEAQLMTTAVPNAKLDVTVIGMRSDNTRVRKLVSGIDLTPVGDEGEHVIHSLDNLSLAELQTIQIEVTDSPTDPTPGPQWHLELLSLMLTGGQQARG